MTAPPDSCKLVDLLHYNADILRSRTGTILDSSSGGNLRHQSPGRTSALGSSGGGGTGKKASKSKASSAKRSPSSSPDIEKQPHRDSSTGRESSSDGVHRRVSDNNNNKYTNIRARLSPAAQRFVAESNEFSSTNGGIRRLPSPVLSRVQYAGGDSINNLRSNDDSAASSWGASRGAVRLREEASVYLRSPVLLHANGSSRGGGAEGGSGRGGESLAVVAGRSHSHSHSSGNPLQDRLREAQRAFAAMRESHQF